MTLLQSFHGNNLKDQPIKSESSQELGDYTWGALYVDYILVESLYRYCYCGHSDLSGSWIASDCLLCYQDP